MLRKKKFQEGLLSRTEGQLDNLERLVHDLEFAQVERQVLDGLKLGNEALKQANAMFSIEEIEQIMEDTAEAIEKQREIDALLSGQLTQEDEEDVLKELEELVGDEDISDLLPEIPSTGKITILHVLKTIFLQINLFSEPVPEQTAKLQKVKEKPKKVALEAS